MFNWRLLAGSVRVGAVTRPPMPPKRQKPGGGGSTAKKNPTVNDDANLKRLESYQLQIKALNNRIVELENDNKSLKEENRTLQKVRPFVLQLGFKINSPTFALYLTFMRKLLMPSYRCIFVVSNKNPPSFP